MSVTQAIFEFCTKPKECQDCQETLTIKFTIKKICQEKILRY
jgi:hypothetical protein